MPITSGFFNSRNGDRVYDALQMGSLFGGIIKDGVFANYPDTGNQNNQFRVVPKAGALAVYVCPGRGWFHNTWINNDSNVEYALQPAPSVNSRIDSLFIKVDLSNNGRKNTIELVTGTPAAQPVAPTKPADTAEIFWYRLATITVRANATTVASQNDIVQFVGSSSLPYITGPLNTVSSDQVLSRWNADWAALLQNINTDWGRFKTDAESQIDETTESYLNTVPNPIQQYVEGELQSPISRITSYDQTVKFFLFLSGRRTDDTAVDPYVSYLPTNGLTATYDGATLSWQKWTNSVLPQQKDIFMDKLGRFAEVTAISYEPDENDNPSIESITVKTFYDPSFSNGLPRVYFLKGSTLNDVGQVKTYDSRRLPDFRGVYAETAIKNGDIVVDDNGRCAIASDIVVQDNYFVSGSFTTFTDLRAPRVFWYDEPYNDNYGYYNVLPAKGVTSSIDANLNWLAVESAGIHPEDATYKLRVNDILIGASGKAARITAVRSEQGPGSVFDVIGIGTVPIVEKATPLIVRFTGDDTCSHTYAQIMAAINAGRMVQFYWNSGVANTSSYALPNFDCNSSSIEANGFDVQSIDGGTLGNFLWYHIHCRIDSNNNVECEYTESGQ